MKWMMKTLIASLTASLLLTACSDPEPSCSNNCDQKDGSVYKSLEGPVDRSKSKEY